MRFINLSCDNCGAPVDVARTTRYVTCAYCSAKLQVVKSKDEFRTEVLERIEDRTKALAGSVKRLELRTRIEELDREWEAWLSEYWQKDENGSYRVPTSAGAYVAAAWCAVLCIVLSLILASQLSWWLLAPGLVLALLLSYLILKRGRHLARVYEKSRERFQRERAQLVEALSGRTEMAGDTP